MAGLRKDDQNNVNAATTTLSFTAFKFCIGISTSHRKKIGLSLLNHLAIEVSFFYFHKKQALKISDY
jgi:hypothetical protein